MQMPTGYSLSAPRYAIVMQLDIAHRRVRSARPDPRVRRLVLTKADYLLFEAIERHGPLPSHYLYEFTRHLRRDRTHLQNRLTEFYNGDKAGAYLTRPRQQFASYCGRYQHLVYDLAPRTRRLLAERRRWVASVPVRCDSFVHRLMTACVSASFELTAVRHKLRYISSAEILGRPSCGKAADARNPLAVPIPGGSLIPDALFGLEYGGAGYRFFSVEVDRNTESIERKNLRQSAFAHKVQAYLTILHESRYRDWWGVPNLHVLTVTTSGTHARNLIQYLSAVLPPAFLSRFACKALPEFGADWSVPKKLLGELLEFPWLSPAGSRLISAS